VGNIVPNQMNIIYLKPPSLPNLLFFSIDFSTINVSPSINEDFNYKSYNISSLPKINVGEKQIIQERPKHSSAQNQYPPTKKVIINTTNPATPTLKII